MTSPSLTVGVAFDDAYLLPGLIALVSAAKALRGESIELVVMTDVDASSDEFITRVEARHGLRIRKVRPSEKTVTLSHLPHLSPMTNARLDLEAWDLTTDRFLYLDSDTFTVRRPSLPARLPSGVAVAGVVDAVIPTHGHLGRLRRDLSRQMLFSEGSREVYLNAGVLLVDVAEWERQDLGKICMEMIASYPNLSDQDALNLALTGRMTSLPVTANAQTALRAGGLSRLVKQGLRRTPAVPPSEIVHFTADKPWKSPRPSPLHAKWLGFLVSELPQPGESMRWLARSLADRRTLRALPTARQ